MASEVMTNEEFMKHINRMVTWMQNAEQLINYCPVCGQPMNETGTINEPGTERFVMPDNEDETD